MTHVQMELADCLVNLLFFLRLVNLAQHLESLLQLYLDVFCVTQPI